MEQLYQIPIFEKLCRYLTLQDLSRLSNVSKRFNGLFNSSLMPINLKNKTDALLKAVRHDNYDIAKLLIEHGANVNAYNTMSFRLAVEHSSLQIIKLLIEAGADIHAFDDQALIIALNKGRIHLALYLLQRGCVMSRAAWRITDELGCLELFTEALEFALLQLMTPRPND